MGKLSLINDTGKWQVLHHSKYGSIVRPPNRRKFRSLTETDFRIFGGNYEEFTESDLEVFARVNTILRYDSGMIRPREKECDICNKVECEKEVTSVKGVNYCRDCLMKKGTNVRIEKAQLSLMNCYAKIGWGVNIRDRYLSENERIEDE